jgi:hypothetical protein
VQGELDPSVISLDGIEVKPGKYYEMAKVSAILFSDIS